MRLPLRLECLWCGFASDGCNNNDALINRAGEEHGSASVLVAEVVVFGVWCLVCWLVCAMCEVGETYMYTEFIKVLFYKFNFVVCIYGSYFHDFHTSYKYRQLPFCLYCIKSRRLSVMAAAPRHLRRAQHVLVYERHLDGKE